MGSPRQDCETYGVMVAAVEARKRGERQAVRWREGALFGLSQGGIVPSYALIVRDYFPAREAGARISLVLMATVAGMRIGGWMSGAIYDLTGSYRAAFLNGIAWNLLNMAIAFWLLLGRLRSADRRPRDDARRPGVDLSPSATS